MEYLGGLRGTGVLLRENAAAIPANYDLDGFLSNSGEVMSSGEICLSASLLKEVFGRPDLQLRTAEGRLLGIRFSEKRLPQAQGAAHVDVNGYLPTAADWRRSSGTARASSEAGTGQ